MAVLPIDCQTIIAGQAYDCYNKQSGGIVQKIYLFNKSDIDISTTIPIIGQDDVTSDIFHTIDSFNLLAGKVGYVFEAQPSKRNQLATFEYAEGDFADYLIHGVNILINNLCPESLATLQGFVDGAEVVAIVENNDKGTNNECAFLVYGFNQGLKPASFVYNSNEANGNVPVELRSKEPNLEPFLPFQYLDTDYATTKANLEALVTP